MKKILCLTLTILIFLSGCTSQTEDSSVPVKKEFSKGVWLSFSEIDAMLSSDKGFKAEFNSVIENLSGLGITDLYFHIRSHCDSIVKSEFFPIKEAAKNADFDILQYVIEECHNNNIRVHGWINPYRVNSADSDITKLSPDSPVIKWLNDDIAENDVNIVISKGIYLNPGEAEVRNLIVSGIKELLQCYSLDGIHFDDYFYPTTDSAFDQVSYEKYKSTSALPLGLDDWRRTNVDILIADCNTAIKLTKPQTVFSISPSANMEKNYNSHYADIKAWCDDGLIDEIIPQIYFGFQHTDTDFCFENLIKEWTDATKVSKATLKIGLATYKIGTSSPTDGDEWQKSDNIIARQTKLCKNTPKIEGVCYFSYSSLFSQQPANLIELENLITVLKE